MLCDHPRAGYRFFFLCRFLRKRFLRLWVLILCRFLFFPHGIFFCSCGAAVSFDARPQFFGWFEDGRTPPRNLDFGSRAWIAAGPRCPANGLERSKPANFDMLAPLQSPDDGLDESIDYSRCIGFCQPRSLGDMPDDVSLRQGRLPLARFGVSSHSNRLCGTAKPPS